MCVCYLTAVTVVVAETIVVVDLTAVTAFIVVYCERHTGSAAAGLVGYGECTWIVQA